MRLRPAGAKGRAEHRAGRDAENTLTVSETHAPSLRPLIAHGEMR